MTHEELMKDRYGSELMSYTPTANSEDFDQKTSTGTVFIEFWREDDIQCRIKSVKYEDFMPPQAKMYKINAEENKGLTNKYKVVVFPTMLIFRQGKLLRKIDGPIEEEQKLKK